MPLSETQAWPVTSIHSPLGTYPPRRSPLLTGRSIGAWARGCEVRLQLAKTSKKTNCDFEVIVPPPCGCPRYERHGFHMFRGCNTHILSNDDVIQVGRITPQRQGQRRWPRISVATTPEHVSAERGRNWLRLRIVRASELCDLIGDAVRPGAKRHALPNDGGVHVRKLPHVFRQQCCTGHRGAVEQDRDDGQLHL